LESIEDKSLQDLQSLSAEVETVKIQLKCLSDEKEQLTDILSQKDKELENFHKQVATLESERNDLQGKHDKLTETCDQLNEQLNTQTTQLQQANLISKTFQLYFYCFHFC
jgi:predicted nuclease with TOPRIM domain